MTVLSALSSAILRAVGVPRRTAVFTSSGAVEAEMADLVNEVAADIARKHDWTALTTLATLEGYAGVEFDLPDDYDRMPKATKVWSTAWPSMFYQRARDLDEWYSNQQFSTSGAPGWWIILGGKFQIYPAPPIGDNAQFYFISRNYAVGADGVAKPAFTADDDTFRLPERLLTLGCVWRWRQQKRLEYAEDLQNYEIALSEAISADKGARILVEGRSRLSGNIGTAYPGVLGP